ncbi:hypothetical protein F5Y12DRAFT_713465 [Xylaria sp. FL1777]|nr:hypothetical protein F5Y12DRAFT_713465 [Xylaria sp. FL1777]
MPDEEMEMAVDFGHAGLGEDIDIDLDFPVGQPDEDMDLEDFDRVHDIQHFNSDTRDELMAEGDDASYGMIDAIEIDHNASAAAANDIDLELEHTVDSIWQQDPPHLADLQPDTEIDYLDETAAETMDAEKNDLEASEWPQAATTAQDADAMDHADMTSVEVFTGAKEAQEEIPMEPSASSYKSPSPPIQKSHTDAGGTYSPVTSGLKGNGEPNDIDDLAGDEVVGVEPQASAQPSATKQDEQSVSQPNADADAKSDSPYVELQESKEHQEVDHPNENARATSGHVDESVISHDLRQLEHPEANATSNEKEDHTDPLLPEEAYESADDSSEYLLGGVSYVDTTNEQTGDDDDAPEAGFPALNRSDSEPRETSSTRDIEGDENGKATAIGMGTPAIGVSGRDDPIELADYYGVYISYGETDYRLFAKSEDDDPNQYFLTDKSALDVSLAQFLTSLREVISEEISPLDDLVMEIDGLGLEFSESTTPDFLGKFTFGDLVVLYDKLVKNEQAESSPPIYTLLTVKPNCTRRMMALGESANAGRGLSEVGLYRDSPSIDEEQVDDVGTPNTNFSTGDYDDGESEGIDLQEDFEDGDALNGDEHQSSPIVTTDVQLEHISDPHDEIDGFENENEEDSVDGSADATDHENYASISKQGIYPFLFHHTFPCKRDSTCLCDDCYEAELQHLATPRRAEVWPTPGTVMPTYSNYTHMTRMTNRTMTEDDATSESLALQLQEASEHSQQPNSQTPEVGQPKPPAPTTAPTIAPTNPPADAPNSENTSVTATLDGEDHDEDHDEEHDEIDYNPDEDDDSIDTGIDGSNIQKQSSVNDQSSTNDLNAAVDDEITWESDDDETKNETKGGSPKDTVQVSPVSGGKRSRAESDGFDDAGDKNDYKRFRA